MRTTILAALLLGAAPLAAPQDSTSRDSLLAREQRRIQGERLSEVPTATPAVVSARQRRIAVALGVVGPADWLEVEGGNGLTMSTGPGVQASLDAAWPKFRRLDLTGTL